MYDRKDIAAMISEIKQSVSHMNVYGRQPGYDPDPDTDKAIKLLEELDEIIACGRDQSIETVTQSVNEEPGWHYVKDGEFPERHTDILFCNCVEQVFEGFYETTDYEHPYLTEEGKIAFPKFPEGKGKWYQFRFRCLENSDVAVAWRYKPAPVPCPEYRDRVARRERRKSL